MCWYVHMSSGTHRDHVKSHWNCSYRWLWYLVWVLNLSPPEEQGVLLITGPSLSQCQPFFKLDITRNVTYQSNHGSAIVLNSIFSQVLWALLIVLRKFSCRFIGGDDFFFFFGTGQSVRELFQEGLQITVEGRRLTRALEFTSFQYTMTSWHYLSLPLLETWEGLLLTSLASGLSISKGSRLPQAFSI